MTSRKRTRLRATVDEITVNADDVELASLITDDGLELIVPLAVLPPGTRDGDVLLIRFEQDPDARAERRQRIAELQEKLFGRETTSPPDPLS
jgi:hypothetical protein